MDQELKCRKCGSDKILVCTFTSKGIQKITHQCQKCKYEILVSSKKLPKSQR